MQTTLPYWPITTGIRLQPPPPPLPPPRFGGHCGRILSPLRGVRGMVCNDSAVGGDMRRPEVESGPGRGVYRAHGAGPGRGGEPLAVVTRYTRRVCAPLTVSTASEPSAHLGHSRDWPVKLAIRCVWHATSPESGRVLQCFHCGGRLQLYSVS